MVTIKSNAKQIAEQFKKNQEANYKKAKEEALRSVAVAALEEAVNKHVTAQEFADGKSYTPPPGGDLGRFVKTRRGKVESRQKFFNSKLVVSRSGGLLDSLKDLISRIKNGSANVATSDDYEVRFSKNRVQIFAVSVKAIVLEVKRAGPKPARRIIKKSMAVAVRWFNKFWLKGNKK
jgi:hypothetical protein